MQELDEIQLRSNTKDARTGRNTHTSILVAADMHATETMNQQWGKKQYLPCGYIQSCWVHWCIKSVHLRDTLYAPDDAVDMECHISVVDHKTTRLCSLVSSWIDTGEMHKIQWKNTNKIQHKRYKNWTKYKYIDPRSHRYACNRNTEPTMDFLWAGLDLFLLQQCRRLVHKECPPQGHSLCTRRCS